MTQPSTLAPHSPPASTSLARATPWGVIALVTFLSALDGYDVLAMSFTAKPVAEQFALDGTALGWLLSAGLIGMAVGAMGFGVLADRIGRRRVVLIGLVLNTLGMLFAALAPGFTPLLIWRVVTGFGVGAVLATGSVLVSELAAPRRRGLALSLYTAGYSLGATFGGLGARELLNSSGWPAVFWLGAILGAVALVAVVVWLPESRGREDAAGDANADATVAAAQAPASLFTGANRRSTLALWAMCFTVFFGFYFAASWTPKLLTELGMTQDQGVLGGIALMFGGAVGALLYGAATVIWSARAVFTGSLALSAVGLVAFILLTEVPGLAFVLGVLVGLFMNAAIAGVYTLAPQAYPAAIRSSGVGVALGVGRVGGIVAPIVVGVLLDAGAAPVALYIGIAILLAVLSPLAFLLRRTT